MDVQATVLPILKNQKKAIFDRALTKKKKSRKSIKYLMH